jgi:hypothetical protein
MTRTHLARVLLTKLKERRGVWAKACRACYGEDLQGLAEAMTDLFLPRPGAAFKDRTFSEELRRGVSTEDYRRGRTAEAKWSPAGPAARG